MIPRSSPQPAGRKLLVLLVQPWLEDFYMTDCRIQPIGLAYLAGSLKRSFADMHVRLYDALAGGHRRTIAWPREFGYLKRYYGAPDSGPFSLFHQYYRFGRSEVEIRADLDGAAPFLIGISSLFTPYYRQSLEMALLCRELFPQTPIVMGGNHATLHPHTLLRPFRGRSVCDYVIRGEGEMRICELVEALLGQRELGDVAGLVTAPDAAYVDAVYAAPVRGRERQPSPDTLAPPDFTGLQTEDYTYDRRPMSFLVTSRSCPHRCTFCSIHAVFGMTYVKRSVGGILDEIRQRYEQGIRHFDIEDDNFTVNRSIVLEVLQGIIRMDVPITFSAMNGLSYISLDRELLQAMRQAGFSSLNLALVSADTLVREFTRRPHTTEKFVDILGIAAEFDLSVTAYFIIGMPGQSLPEMWATLKILAAGRCLVGASPFYFTPGSPIHRQTAGSPGHRLASADGGDAFFSSRLTAMDLETPDFSRDDIYTLFRLTRVINWVKRGIDAGVQPLSDGFAAAGEVFAGGHWPAASSAGAHELPFSPRIADLIHSEPVIVKGYRSQRSVVWRPKTGSWAEINAPASPSTSATAARSQAVSNRLISSTISDASA